MSTLRGFVDAVWQSDDKLFDSDRPNSSDGGARMDNPVWSKPDTRDPSFELRRIVTEKAKNYRACDFYELYWADLIQGTTWEHVHTWIRKLLFRPVSKVPKRLLAAWIVLWMISLMALTGLIYSILPYGKTDNADQSAVLATSSFIFSAGVSALINFVFLKYVGDVARYVSATPSNVKSRQAIRERGVALLQRLMTPNRDEKTGKEEFQYDRIIVVGHSLGTIIGYDILKQAFANLHDNFEQDKMATQPARHALEKLLQDALQQGRELNLNAYRDAQDRARKELIDLGSPWIVSDFISIGSPLAHSEVLLSDGVKHLRQQQRERILPTSPPELEFDATTAKLHFSYWGGPRRNEDDAIEASLTRIPHFSAHFALTKWSNIYSPSKAVIWGDIVSGPVADQFAYIRNDNKVSGVMDVPVMAAGDGGRRLFTHTHYWNLEGKTGQDVPKHVLALRAAINFLEKKEVEIDA